MRLASRGLRDMGNGYEPITDADERRAVQAQARRVMIRSIVATIVVMVPILVLF